MGRLVRAVKHRLTYLIIIILFMFIIYAVYLSSYKSNWTTHLKTPGKVAVSDEKLAETYRRGDNNLNHNKFNNYYNNNTNLNNTNSVEYSQDDVMFLFNEATNNKQLQINFKNCITSLLSKTSNSPKLHIIGDRDSLHIAEKILQSIDHHRTIEVAYHNRTEVLSSVFKTVASIHAQLSAEAHHFSDPLFYISLVIHRIMPANMTRLVILDVDLIFTSDVADLFSLFNNFSADQAIGIARENQPVYRNVFWDYRKKHPGTRVGDPPPDGFTGFNSGVVLFDLVKLRKSSLYNSFLSGDNLLSLVRKYKFKGHLGDQDFFTLLSFEYGSLFYILPCGWNRQLCMWWRRDEFVSVFHRYYSCSGPVHIWHSNCNTSLVR